MSRMQRNKGKAGEREVAGQIRELTGWDVQRRVRQHDGDSDLVGVPGWSVEVKRRRAATPGDIVRWWAQAVAQAGELQPVLLFRLDRQDWRAVWSLAALLGSPPRGDWLVYRWTAETGIDAWAAAVREGQAQEAAPVC